MTESSAKCPITLKTADQYDLWKGRVADACWSVTHKSLFEVTDEDCKAAINAFEIANEAKKPQDWVGKCWMIVTGSLHDDVYRKIAQVPRGLLASLLKEISHALVVCNLEEVAPLRLELYGANMAKDAGNDLQSWITFLLERSSKLAFLKKQVPEEEIVAIFLKGLPPVFQQLQVYFAIPGQMPDAFEKAIAITRKFAANPTIAAELAKLKSSGTSQSMFPVTTNQPPRPNNRPAPLCRQFARSGSCSFGTRCRFTHTATPAPTGNRPTCTYCSRLGHTADVCRKRMSDRSGSASVPPVTMVVTPEPAANHAQPAPADNNDEFSFVLTVSSTTPELPNWILDSGATCCATFDEADCIDVRDCQVNVTAAGSTFQVGPPSSTLSMKQVAPCS
jgi:hypothetical protein